jgi:hypothetical protein
MANENKTPKLLPGGVTQEQFDGWKNSGFMINQIDVAVSADDTATCYITKPRRDHVAVAMSLYAKDKILECGEFILNNAWLGGDVRCKTDEDISMAASIQASSTIKFLEATIKKH